MRENAMRGCQKAASRIYIMAESAVFERMLKKLDRMIQKAKTDEERSRLIAEKADAIRKQHELLSRPGSIETPEGHMQHRH